MRSIVDRLCRVLRSPAGASSPGPPALRRVLLTGAGGVVAQMIRPALAARYVELRLTDLTEVAPAHRGESFVAAALDDEASVDRAVAGMQAVIHFGAVSKEAPMQALMPANILGAYNVLEAARRHRVERVIFASTLHVMGFYERDVEFDETSPLRPDSRYAASKVFGEALAQLYARKHGIALTCLRIGHVKPSPEEAEPGLWISPEDLLQLIVIGLEHPEIHCETFHAVADHPGQRLSDGRAERFGYRCRRPGLDAAEVASRQAAWFGAEGPARDYRGAYFVEIEHPDAQPRG